MLHDTTAQTASRYPDTRRVPQAAALATRLKQIDTPQDSRWRDSSQFGPFG